MWNEIGEGELDAREDDRIEALEHPCGPFRAPPSIHVQECAAAGR